jgi:O-Antigen ligase
MNRISSALLIGTVVLAPLPFGSTDRATVAFWCIVLGTGLIFASPRALGRGQVLILVGAAVLALAFVFVLHEQLSSHPWLAAPNPIWRTAAENLGISLEPSVATVRNEPFNALGAPLASFLALTCAIVVCADSSRARQLMHVIAWSGAAYAAFAIPWTLLEPGKNLWRDRQSTSSALAATFVSRNTAAAYFGSCTVVWLLLLCHHVRRQLPAHRWSWKQISTHRVSDLSATTILRLGMLLLCFTAMLMTASRGGIVLSLLGLIVAFSLYVLRNSPRRIGALLAILISAAVAFLVLQTLGGAATRFEVEGLAGGGRAEIYRSTLEMIRDHPWFGTGLGTFPSTFPAYRSASGSMRGIWTMAHSTPLEMAAELGIPLTAAIAGGWIIALAVLFRGALRRRRDAIIPIAALAVALLALLHSFVDFTLQVPGYAVAAFALIGAGLSQSFSHQRRPPASPREGLTSDRAN